MNKLLSLGCIVGLVLAQRRFVGDYQPGKSHKNSLNINATASGSDFSAKAATLIFEDNFDTLNFKTWRHEVSLSGGGNWEFQHYTNNRTSSYVKNGVLYLKPVLTADAIGESAVINGGNLDVWGGMPNFQCTSNSNYGCSRSSNGFNYLNPIQSAQLRSVNKINFAYGKVEIRARMPKGDWLWPAIWLLPTDHEYGMWPSSGEIDLVEARGNSASYPSGGVDTVASTLHWGPSYEFNQYGRTTGAYKLPNGQSFSDDFHTFTLEWTPNTIRTTVDNNQILNIPINQSFWQRGQFPSYLNNPWQGQSNSAPFNKDFYLIFNVAVGGTNGYFPDGQGGKPWGNGSPSAAKDFYSAKNQWYSSWPADDTRALAIDYVRVWSMA